MRRKKKSLSKLLKLKQVINGFRVSAFIKTILVITILALSMFIYQIIQRELNGLQVITVAHTSVIDVHLLQKEEMKKNPLAADVKAYIRTVMQKQKRINLTKLSRLIQREFAAQQVSLVCINDHELHVRLQPRRPIFAIGEATDLRISEKGEIFKENHAGEEKLVSVHGIIPTEAQKLRYDDEGRVILDPTKQQAAKTAVELLTTMQREGFDYTEFHYYSFRGFSLSGSQKYPLIMIGEKNFSERFGRLRALMKKSAGSSQIATKIELDYDDKAFINEKAL